MELSAKSARGRGAWWWRSPPGSPRNTRAWPSQGVARQRPLRPRKVRCASPKVAQGVSGGRSLPSQAGRRRGRRAAPAARSPLPQSEVVVVAVARAAGGAARWEAARECSASRSGSPSANAWQTIRPLRCAGQRRPLHPRPFASGPTTAAPSGPIGGAIKGSHGRDPLCRTNYSGQPFAAAAGWPLAPFRCSTFACRPPEGGTSVVICRPGGRQACTLAPR